MNLLHVHWQRSLMAMLAVLLLGGCVGLTLQDEISGLMKQGQQLYAEKKYDEALDKFVDVALKDPGHWQAYVWSARVLIAKGNWFDAIQQARKAFDKAPQGENVLPVLAEALLGGGSDALKSGRYAEAVAYFVDYLKFSPDNARAWLDVGKAYLGQNQFREALGAFIQGLAKGNADERKDLLAGLLNGGVQALKSGKHKDAVATLKEYLKHDGDNVTAYVNLARAYWESGELGNTLETFQNVLRLDPKNEEALRFLLRR